MIEAIVLAAGEGKRLARIKPLVPIDGVPALVRVIRTVRKAGIERIIVVLGHAATTIQGQVELVGCRVVVNPSYEHGISSSLIAGLGSLSKQAKGALIFHADMPYVKEETIRTVIAQAEAGSRIVAPSFCGQRGFPVFLHRFCLKELLPTLSGDIGARRFLAEHPDDLVLVEVADPGAIRDFDELKALPRKESQYEPTVREG